MPTYRLPDGREISAGTAFVLNDITFPPSWLIRATAEDLSEHGIIEIPDPEPQQPSLAEARSAKDAEAWDECNRRMEAAIVTVATSAGTHNFSLGRESRENIIGINLEITAELEGRLPAGTVPNPRPWTPADSIEPIMLTHDDLALVGSELRKAKEAYLRAYFAHKAAIYAEANVNDVLSYDVRTGWPS